MKMLNNSSTLTVKLLNLYILQITGKSVFVHEKAQY